MPLSVPEAYAGTHAAPPDIDPAEVTGRIIQADSLLWMRRLPAESVGAIISDPPYSTGGMTRSDRANQTTRAKYQNSETVKRYPEFDGDNRDQRSYLRWLSMICADLYRIASPAAPIALFADWRQLSTVSDALQIGGFVWRGIAVWDKTQGARPQHGRFRAQAEYIVWGTKGPAPIDKSRPCLPGVFRHFPTAGEKHHVTGKPLPLMLEIIELAPPAALVFDPFAGSGTTCRAAKLSGRPFIGLEVTADCARVARRLTAATLPLTPTEGKDSRA